MGNPWSAGAALYTHRCYLFVSLKDGSSQAESGPSYDVCLIRLNGSSANGLTCLIPQVAMHRRLRSRKCVCNLLTLMIASTCFALLYRADSPSPLSAKFAFCDPLPTTTLWNSSRLSRTHMAKLKMGRYCALVTVVNRNRPPVARRGYR